MATIRQTLGMVLRAPMALAAMVAAALGGCGQSGPPLEAVGRVDLDRYAGR